MSGNDDRNEAVREIENMIANIAAIPGSVAIDIEGDNNLAFGNYSKGFDTAVRARGKGNVIAANYGVTESNRTELISQLGLLRATLKRKDLDRTIVQKVMANLKVLAPPVQVILLGFNIIKLSVGA